MPDNPPKQNMASFTQAVDDLLDDIQNGSNSAIRGPIDPATGRMIITYSFNSSDQSWVSSHRKASPEEKDQAAKDRTKLPDDVLLKPLTPIEDHPEVTTAIRKAMDDIESVCNVKFVPVYHVDKRDSANLCFLDGDITGQSGHARQNTNPTGRRDIFINTHYNNSAETVERGTHGYKTIIHEIMHGMGVSHPGASGKGGTSGGDNAQYSDKGTLMSYNNADTRGMAPFDLAVLQYLYNEPQLKNGAKAKTTFTAEDLLNVGTIYSPSKAVDIDLSQTNKKGRLTADLSAKLPGEGGISGLFDHTVISLGYADGVRVRNISAAGSNVSLEVTGNELPNRFVGAKNSDEITFRGGNDTATGESGYDFFIFDERSGKGNVITDFSRQDSIHIGEKIEKVAVITDPVTRNNKLLFADKNGKIVADVILQGPDEELQKEILEKKVDIIFHKDIEKNKVVAVQMVDPMEIAEYAQGVKAEQAAAKKLEEEKKAAAAKKLAEEAAAKKLAEEKKAAAAKKLAEEAAAKKLEEEKKAAAAKKLAEEAAAKKLEEEKKAAAAKKLAEEAAAKKLEEEKKAAAAAKKLEDEKKPAAIETTAGASAEPESTPHKAAPATGWNHWMEENAQWAMPLMTALPVLAAALSGGGGILLALLAAGIAALVGVGLARQYQDAPESTSVVAHNVANGGVDTRQASNTDGLLKAKALFDQGYRASDMQDNGHGLSNGAVVRSGKMEHGIV